MIYFSGNYTGWKATCIGNNSSAAVSMLKQVKTENYFISQIKQMIKTIWILKFILRS
jgi:hypothetical protein